MSGQECKRPLRQWLHDFFQYSIKNKKNFYWSWKDFMITIRKEKKQRMLILEIFLKCPPFLVQKHIDITGLDDGVLMTSLLYLHDHFYDSPLIRRNQEHSSQFLSFRSFVQSNDNIKPFYQQSCLSLLLISYIVKTLEKHGIYPVIKRQNRLWSLSQFVSSTKKSCLKH